MTTYKNGTAPLKVQQLTTPPDNGYGRGGRKGGRDGGREEGREEGREGGREEGREGGVATRGLCKWGYNDSVVQ